jgi:hypothetical protein
VLFRSDACILNDARVSGNARVFEDTCVSGDAHIAGNAVIRGNSHIFNGLWKTSPLQIQGSRFFFNMAGENLIAVGCQVKTAEKWRDVYKEKFKEHHFTEEEQIEYIRYFNLASDMYGFGFRLPFYYLKIHLNWHRICTGLVLNYHYLRMNLKKSPHK